MLLAKTNQVEMESTNLNLREQARQVPPIGEDYLSLDARKPVSGDCEQQSRRPTCACAQTDQSLCFSLHI